MYTGIATRASISSSAGERAWTSFVGASSRTISSRASTSWAKRCATALSCGSCAKLCAITTSRAPSPSASSRESRMPSRPRRAGSLRGERARARRRGLRGREAIRTSAGAARAARGSTRARHAATARSDEGGPVACSGLLGPPKACWTARARRAGARPVGQYPLPASKLAVGRLDRVLAFAQLASRFRPVSCAGQHRVDVCVRRNDARHRARARPRAPERSVRRSRRRRSDVAVAPTTSSESTRRDENDRGNRLHSLRRVGIHGSPAERCPGQPGCVVPAGRLRAAARRSVNARREPFNRGQRRAHRSRAWQEVAANVESVRSVSSPSSTARRTSPTFDASGRDALSRARRPAGGAGRLVREIGAHFETLSGSLAIAWRTPSVHRGRWRRPGGVLDAASRGPMCTGEVPRNPQLGDAGAEVGGAVTYTLQRSGSSPIVPP